MRHTVLKSALVPMTQDRVVEFEIRALLVIIPGPLSVAHVVFEASDVRVSVRPPHLAIAVSPTQR